jgi:hypothetical protein
VVGDDFNDVLRRIAAIPADRVRVGQHSGLNAN